MGSPIQLGLDKICQPQPLQKEGQWHCFNLKGQPLFGETFSELRQDYGFWGKTPSGWRLLSQDAKGQMATGRWPTIPRTRDQYFAIPQNGKYGLVDLDGTLLIPFEWDTLVHDYNYTWARNGQTIKVLRSPYDRSFDVEGQSLQLDHTGCYFVQRNGRKYIYTNHGKPLNNEGYRTIQVQSAHKTVRYFTEKAVGEWVLLPEYDNILTSSNDVYLSQQNIALAYIQKDGKWGIVDFLGKILVPPTYDTIVYSGKEGQFEVTLAGKTSTITLNF